MAATPRENAPAESLTAPRRTLTAGRMTALIGVLAAASLPATFGFGAVADAAALYALAESSNPYFQPHHAFLLYAWTPLVAQSACVMLLAPGLLLAMALGAPVAVGQWVVYGFALSVVIVSAAAGLTQAAIGSPLVGGPFAAVVLACSAGACVALLLRNRWKRVTWPLGDRSSRLSVAAMVLGPLAALVLLAPKFYWENFNGDGAHAFGTARLLLVQPVPFWPSAAGQAGSFPSLNSSLFAYPTSWFIRLFGESEAAARLPVLMYLMALYGGITAAVEWGRRRALSAAEHGLILLQLAVYVLVMAYSATYNPYFADLALPATQDTLTMVCFLGAVTAWAYGSRAWLSLFVVLLSLSLPNGLMLVALLALAAAVVWRPRPWGRLLAVGGAMAASGLLLVLGPAALQGMGLPAPGDEYAGGNLLGRIQDSYAEVQSGHRLSDIWPLLWSRVIYLLLPCGILPALLLPAWRWQDKLARTLSLVTMGYFAFFFVQKHAALHHFVPVMILPLVVFWRTSLVLAPRTRRWALGGVALGTLAALMLCLPRDLRPHTSARTVGAAIEDRIGGYERYDPAVFARSELLADVIPYVWDAAEEGGYSGSPLMWNFYAQTLRHERARVNYILQSAEDPAPDGTRRITSRGGVALYVRSEAVWERHRALRPPITFAARAFRDPGGRGWAAGTRRADARPP